MSTLDSLVRSQMRCAVTNLLRSDVDARTRTNVRTDRSQMPVDRAMLTMPGELQELLDGTRTSRGRQLEDKLCSNSPKAFCREEGSGRHHPSVFTPPKTSFVEQPVLPELKAVPEPCPERPAEPPHVQGQAIQQTFNMEPVRYKRKEAAHKLQMSARKLDYRIKSGELPTVPDGGTPYILSEVIDEYKRHPHFDPVCPSTKKSRKGKPKDKQSRLA